MLVTCSDIHILDSLSKIIVCITKRQFCETRVLTNSEQVPGAELQNPVKENIEQYALRYVPQYDMS